MFIIILNLFSQIVRLDHHKNDFFNDENFIPKNLQILRIKIRIKKEGRFSPLFFYSDFEVINYFKSFEIIEFILSVSSLANSSSTKILPLCSSTITFLRAATSSWR